MIQRSKIFSAALIVAAIFLSSYAFGQVTPVVPNVYTPAFASAPYATTTDHPKVGTVQALGGTSIVIPPDGFHLTLSVQTLGSTVWFRVGTSTVSIAGPGHEQLTFGTDFDLPSSAVVGLISSTTASVTYRIDRADHHNPR